MPAKRKAATSSPSSATIGFEAKLWLTADKLRNNMDAAEYKHVVLGLIFLKYISDTAGKCRIPNSECRTRKARTLRHSKFVIRHLRPPADARWSHLQASAKQPTIGKTVDWQMSKAEVRMTNRSRFTSTFEIQQSKFA
jgi:type I restriction enzyme M protein